MDYKSDDIIDMFATLADIDKIGNEADKTICMAIKARLIERGIMRAKAAVPITGRA